MNLPGILGWVVPLLLAPLLPGIINRVKAFFAGRRGQPILQAYFDMAKLFRKGAVYSRTTTWIFRASPVVGLTTVMSALLFVPFGEAFPALAFAGDLVALFYLLGLSRFFMISAALDTGSAFEGMGASREALFSALSEPALFVGLLALVRARGSVSMAGIFGPSDAVFTAPLVLVGLAFFCLLLSENSRIPVDDPNTHLELTMIHEVMVLDHSGPDLALILYASTLKLWLFSALVVHVLLPPLPAAAFLGSVLLVAVAVGVAESILARLRMDRVAQFLAGAGVLNAVALVLVLKG